MDGQGFMGSQKQMVPLIIDFVDEMYKEHRMGQRNHQKIDQEFVLPLWPRKDNTCCPAEAVGSGLDSEKGTKVSVRLINSTWTFCVY